jgi:hypothetical protein
MAFFHLQKAPQREYLVRFDRLTVELKSKESVLLSQCVEGHRMLEDRKLIPKFFAKFFVPKLAYRAEVFDESC